MIFEKILLTIYLSFYGLIFYLTGDYIIFHKFNVFPFYSNGSLFPFFEEKPCREIIDINFYYKFAIGFLYTQYIGCLLGLFSMLIIVLLFIIYIYILNFGELRNNIGIEKIKFD